MQAISKHMVGISIFFARKKNPQCIYMSKENHFLLILHWMTLGQSLTFRLPYLNGCDDQMVAGEGEDVIYAVLLSLEEERDVNLIYELRKVGLFVCLLACFIWVGWG